MQHLHRALIPDNFPLCVIDGANIGHFNTVRGKQHDKKFSSDRLLQAVKQCLVWHLRPVILLPQKFINSKHQHNTAKDVEILLAMENQKPPQLIQLPSYINDDNPILDFALKYNGYVLSNDGFQDHIRKGKITQQFVNSQQFRCHLGLREGELVFIPPEGFSAGVRMSNQENQPREIEAKTCTSWQRTGKCTYGDKCHFKHSNGKPAAPRTPRTPRTHHSSSIARDESTTTLKTEECSHWESTGSCPYGDRCHYKHNGAAAALATPGENVLVHDDALFLMKLKSKTKTKKTRICSNWQKNGSCSFGDRCHFKHDDDGASELEMPGNDRVSMEKDIEERMRAKIEKDYLEKEKQVQQRINEATQIAKHVADAREKLAQEKRAQEREASDALLYQEAIQRSKEEADAERERRQKQNEATCCICYDDRIVDLGVTCESDHFTCENCLQDHVAHQNQQVGVDRPNFTTLAEQGRPNGKVRCPVGADCCSAPPFSDAQLAKRIEDDTFENYLTVQRRIAEQNVYEEQNQKWMAEVQRIQLEYEQQQTAHKVQVDRSLLAEQMQRQFPDAYQCGQCGHGPILHGHCSDLAAHHGERRGQSVINNACPVCGWFSKNIRQ